MSTVMRVVGGGVMLAVALTLAACRSVPKAAPAETAGVGGRFGGGEPAFGGPRFVVAVAPERTRQSASLHGEHRELVVAVDADHGSAGESGGAETSTVEAQPGRGGDAAPTSRMPPTQPTSRMPPVPPISPVIDGHNRSPAPAAGGAPRLTLPGQRPAPAAASAPVLRVWDRLSGGPCESHSAAFVAPVLPALPDSATEPANPPAPIVVAEWLRANEPGAADWRAAQLARQAAEQKSRQEQRGTLHRLFYQLLLGDADPAQP